MTARLFCHTATVNSTARVNHRPQTIGGVVKSLRTSSGMTSEQLAVFAGLSPSYIRKLENVARHAVTLDTAKKLANGLGVSPNVFFQADTSKGSLPMTADAIPHLMNQLQQWTSSVQNSMTALVEEYERMRGLDDAMSESIIVVDKGKVLSVNRALMDLLGSWDWKTGVLGCWNPLPRCHGLPAR